MESVIVAGARTPIGRFLGSLATVPAPQLAGVAIREALSRSGFAPEEVDCVVLGQVLAAGVGQAPARQAAVAAGLPMSVPAMAVNKVCLSGLAAIALADQMIRAGDAEVVVAGGMESMSRTPHLLPTGRTGRAFGDLELLDHLGHDGLRDVFTDRTMGALTDQVNREGSPGWTRGPLSREAQDAYAARSHRLAAAAWAAGRFDAEVVPVEVPTPRGAPTLVGTDEGIRPDTTPSSLARLRPAFHPDGTITAGSSSQLSDGAAAVVVARRDLVQSRSGSWLARIGPFASVAGPDSSLQCQPAAAIRRAAGRLGADPAGFDLYEINEAFAAVALASAADLGLDGSAVQERLNVNGGAIALGHPVGMSGARVALTLALELGRRGGGTGVAALCGGGGLGDALVLNAG